MSSSPIVNEAKRPEISGPMGDTSKGTTPPASGAKSSGEERKSRRTSLQVQLPKLPSSESLSNSPGPGSPGVSSWTESTPKIDANIPDKISMPDSAGKLTRKESYKAQRKTYRKEKKRVAHELLCSLQDPAVVVLADWLKVRGTLKSWTKLWCVLKPGLLLIYKSPKTKSSHWVGTILLTSCQVIERPSKKDGFCFKLFHPLEQSIWAPRGPDKETIGAVVQPLPTAYLIFRAPSQAAGKCWLDALELSLRCSALLVRSVSGGPVGIDAGVLGHARSEHETQWSEADYEKHFNEHDLDADSQADCTLMGQMSGVDTDTESDTGAPDNDAVDDTEPPETPYVPNEEVEDFGSAGEQVEELPEEHKSLIWFLVKQVRPGMDLSKVVLPTFILEPRSFLDKLTDTYYHADILSKAVLEDDAFTRMKCITKWYLSGFYKKPRGLKKPYNPILGETFRCYWQHPNGSRTFYLAEQVSHHPPVSALYVTNRQDGFCISASILAKSKFYGNSTSAILEGTPTLTLLPRGETYTLAVPYAHCKGILMGTLTMEYGGKVAIDCEKTGYRTELEFKLKPFLGGSEVTNAISGRLKLGKETLATIYGHWDGQINIKDSRTGEEHTLWNCTPEMRTTRLKRFTVSVDSQGDYESERLWQHVSAAIHNDDQVAATEEKTVLEEAQRARAKELKATCSEWMPQHFQQDMVTGQWYYKHADLRPWDPRNDVIQYEHNYLIQTKTRHQTPMIRTASIISADPGMPLLQAESRTSLAVLKSSRRALVSPRRISSSPDRDGHSDSSSEKLGHQDQRILETLQSIHATLKLHSERLANLQSSIDALRMKTRTPSETNRPAHAHTIIIVIIALMMQSLLSWLFYRK